MLDCKRTFFYLDLDKNDDERQVFSRIISAFYELVCFLSFSQVYEKRPMISGGEGTLISIFPNGCKALNEANPEIVEKVCVCYY